MRIMTLLCALLLLFACTAKAPEFTEADKTALVTSIEAKANQLLIAANALDPTALEEFLADTPQKNFFMGGVACNKAELIAVKNAEYAEYISQKVTVRNHSIKVISPSAVLWIGEIATDIIYLDDLAESQNSTETWLWEKTGDHWQVSHFHESWD
ncbi:MAG: nuclear transport factor 2 family protein [Candidatus Cloacimonetes bacterium]|nr:nuclear transport factor 2 family protein [Candidatus Cloacimonadota bacterium]MDY0172150.1 nuclear transport factor 2 family protein [Candidatus Cloacimonadaceae bacterium]